MPILKNNLAKALRFRIKNEKAVGGSDRIQLIPGIAVQISDSDFETIKETGLYKHHAGNINIIEDAEEVIETDINKMTKPQLIKACEDKGLEPEGNKSDLIALLELAEDGE